MEGLMNFKKIYIGLALSSLCSFDAKSSEQIIDDKIANISQSRTPSTYSFISEMKDYDDLPLEDKYKANLREFRQDRINSLKRMGKLALDDNYENAQLYLAECYRTGVFGKSDIEKAIELNKKAFNDNQSFIAATMLARIFWANGDFDEAKEYCEKAKLSDIRKNNSLEFINDLLRRMNEE